MFMHLPCWVMNTVEEQRGYPIKCLGIPPRTALPNDPAKYFQLEYCFEYIIREDQALGFVELNFLQGHYWEPVLKFLMLLITY